MTADSRTQLPPQYTPGDVESRRYQDWVARGLFGADPGTPGPAYCIVIPPPNVTGSLHMGHALDHTLMDALIRRRRMQGYVTLWLPGMDHAGIATQNVVERELARQGQSRHDLGREAFVERVWQWKAESGGTILGQMRRLGDSVDWSRERFTMDEGLSRAVQTIFKRLFDDGLIYRAERIINWCPRCLTALSDIEVDHAEEDGELVSIRYGDGPQSVVVATTRAETMLGDTAVAVHPDDPRYAHLVGTDVELPLSGRRIPVIADPHVDPEFGTGAVKVTPAHDPDDFEIGRRHNLPSLTIMDERGVITAPGPFAGLDRFEARPAVVAALREQGRIVAEVRPYLHAVGHCSRCGTVVEPRLSLQWFVKVEPLAKAAGDAVRDGRVRHPPGRDGGPLLRLGRRHARLVHQPPVVVGAPDPGLVRPRGRDPLRRPRRAAAGRGRLAAGPGRARHLVLLRAVAVLHPRLARRHRRPAPVLPDLGPGHRLRHPVLLGRPDDDVRPVRDAGGRPGRRRCRSAQWHCTAWSATRTGARCPSRAATRWTRWTGSTGSVPTPPGSPWPAAPARAATWRSARNG